MSDELNLVTNTIHNMIKDNDLPSSAKVLVNKAPTCSKFYMLPKIHKKNSTGRPIVSTCNCPTVVISQFLGSIFTPIVQTLPTYIKDSSEAIRIFNQFYFTGDHKYVFTMDVRSLYTSIPIDDGLNALKHFLEKDNPSNCSTSCLIRLAELVLRTASFSFNGNYYRQISGVSMGTRMGPSFACLFMGYLEEQIFARYSGATPHLFKRYIDDVVGTTSCSLDELNDFIDYVSNFHPAIKFTYAISSTHVTFLDIELSISDIRLSTSVFYKSTDAHTFLNYKSSQPPSC
ncbi:uncharacterized protein LOC117123022 [Anneissia japonica]|uniref:uncharacterized protein LOC117123022 n=1 Tax=Anneissia japonica TaxID=1529436 RepID=UPI0014255836|nr:uncharacterized protein LOC117123022 [Anneissia japonica]